MAKTPKNAEKFPIEWDGTVKGGENQGDSIPSDVNIVWGNNPFTWGDVSLAVEIAEVIDGVGYTRRKERLDKLFKDEDKKKRFIHLVCRIKGEKVYDDEVQVKDVHVSVEDAELVVETLVKRVKLEIKSGI